MEFKTRALYPDELRRLNTLKTKTEKNKTKTSKSLVFFWALLLGIVCTCVAVETPKDSFWFFIFGTVAVFSFATAVFKLFNDLKAQDKNKNILQRVHALIDKQTVDTCPVNATRIALAETYEDESDWYIFELGNDKILRYWDVDFAYNSRKFPCLQFEIYEKNFAHLTGNDIYPLSEKIKPVVLIDPKKKWKYMCQFDPFEHLVGAGENIGIANIGFDELISQIEML
jgi:hypothetical protein